MLRGHAAIVERAGYDPVLYADTYAQGFDLYCRRIEVEKPELAEFFRMNPDCHEPCGTLVEEPAAGRIFMLCDGTREQRCARSASNSSEPIPDDLYIHVLRSPAICRLYVRNRAGRRDQVERHRALAHEWGIADEEICAVGDDVNDIPMIRAAGLGVAMGNAQEEVKAAADRICAVPRRRRPGRGRAWLLC